VTGTPRRRREHPAAARARRAEIDDPAVVLEAALRFLEPRARSVAEVRRRLTGNGYRAELVDTAIERLLDLGMLDDAAFARHWVESRDRARPRGRLGLTGELRRLGIDPATIAAVLDEREAAAPGRGASDATAEGDAPASADEDAARRLLERKARALARYDPRQRRSRAYALLARHGFEPAVCSTIAAEAARAVTGAALAPAEDAADALPDDP
jgi:regulatory protein